MSVIKPMERRVRRNERWRLPAVKLLCDQFCRISAPSAMPRLMASCWLTAIRLLPLPVWCARRSAMVRVFMAENWMELQVPMRSSRTIHALKDVSASGRASSIINMAKRHMFQINTLR